MGIQKISPAARAWGVLGSTLVVLAAVVAFDVQESAAVAPINELNVTRLVPADEIGSQFFDQFGASVSVCGEFAVVGSPGTDGEEFSGGTARVFEFNGTGWSLVQTLFDEEGEGYGDDFGRSVAIAGKTMVIGAPGAEAVSAEFNETIPAGLVFVYQRLDEEFRELAVSTPGYWQLVDVISSPEPFPRERFGSSVAISGDHIVVGTEPEFFGEFSSHVSGFSGSAYVYRTGDEGWEFLQALEPLFSEGDGDGEGSFATESFGQSVAISDRIIVVGAPVTQFFGPQENGFLPTGSAYMFQLREGLFVPTLRLTPEDDFEGFGLPKFGTSVDISGRTIVVGAPMGGEFEEGPGFNETSGRAYVFEAVGAWQQADVLSPIEDEVSDNPAYGESVAISSDSGDVIVVGSPRPAEFAQGVPEPGFFGSAVHVYERVAEGGDMLFNNTHVLSFPFNEFGNAVDTTSLFTCVGSPFFDSFDWEGAAHITRLLEQPEGTDSSLQIRRALVRGRAGNEQLFVSGNLDIGKPDFSAPAVIRVLEDEFEFSGFREVERPRGNSLFVATEPFRVTLLESRFGSSNTRISMRLPNFESPGGTFELPVAFNGTTAAVVMNNNVFSRYSRNYPGSQLAPDFGVGFLRGQLTGTKHDRLVIRGKIATDGTMPEELPCLVVAIGDTFRQVIEPARLRRGVNGVSFSQGRRPGVSRMILNYRTGAFTVLLRNISLGCPGDGPVSMQVTFGECDSPGSTILCVQSEGNRLLY